MNATKKIIATIAQAKAITYMLDRAYDSKIPTTVQAMLDRLETSTDGAFRAWPMSISEEDIGRVYAVYRGVELDEMTTTSVYCSYLIDVIGEILTHIKDKRRYKALDDVLRAVAAIHRYYDRREDKHEDYLIGFEISQKFQEACR